MPNHFQKPTGRFAISFSIFSIVALLLGFAAELTGTFDGPNATLEKAWENGGIVLSRSTGLTNLSGFLIGTCAILGLVAAVLGTPGNARRVILGLSALALSLALIPVFAVWGIFWKPFGLTLGIFWAWFSSFIYARTHRMPCEGVTENSAQNVIHMKHGLPPENRSRRSDG
ncbi:hypothetical protein N9B42_01280 [Akkermansiaceae bacterium]|nr:hypothetical protein [Akkermansiaceae bacterium]